METNLDSVLDRLRVLEQRMDERPVQQVIVQQGSGKMPAETGAVQEPAGNKAPAKAAPEDLQKIVAGWRVITGQTTGMFKQMLQKSVPKYNSETGEPVLYVEFQDSLGSPMWTIRKRRKSFRTSSLLRQENSRDPDAGGR